MLIQVEIDGKKWWFCNYEWKLFENSDKSGSTKYVVNLEDNEKRQLCNLIITNTTA